MSGSTESKLTRRCACAVSGAGFQLGDDDLEKKLKKDEGNLF